MSAPARFAPPGPLGCGGAPLGNLFAPVTETDARAMLDAAWDAGVRFYDTAPFYGFGLSEHRFGDALRVRDRAAYTLCTKVGRLIEPADNLERTRFNFVDGLPFAARFDYSAAGARRSLEDSRQRLGIPKIDIALIHDVGEDTHGDDWQTVFDTAMNGAAKELERMRAAGEIRAYGLGVNLVEPCLRALDRADPDVFLLAGRYTLLDHELALAELFPRCAERNVKIIIGGPYNSGLLAGGDTYNYESAPADLVDRVRRLQARCRDHGIPLKAAALQFCAAHPVVASVIPGTKTPERVRQNVDLMAQPIPGAFWAELKHDGIIPPDAPTP